MSENYKYSECKHCGKSVMESEIHSCKQMLRDENEFLRKNLNATAEEYDAALGKIARLQVDLHQTVVDLEETKELLHKFAYFDEFAKTWTARPQGKSTAINHVSAGA